MKLNRKIEIAQQAIASISTHDDEDAAVRLAALARVESFIASEKARIQADIDAQIEAKLS
jgi:hypothetical protein